MEDYYKRKCANCGHTYGSHHGGSSPWPRDYCPGHEGQMDWENGPGTCFKLSMTCICTGYTNHNPDPVPNPDCPIHRNMFR